MVNGPGPLNPAMAWASWPTRLQSAMYEPVTAIDAEATRIVWALGAPDSALRRAESNVERVRTVDHPETFVFSLVFCAFVHQFRREPERALARAEQVMQLCDEHELAQMRAWGAPVHGWALAMTERIDEGIDELRQCLALHAAIQSRLVLPYFHSLLAEALIAKGDRDAALAVVDEGLAMAAETSQAFHEPDLQRLRGELLLARDPADRESAERHLRRAVDLAHEQGARSYELRAAIALAELLRDTGRSAEARALLSPTYEAFTEGLETQDLRRAATLLASLCGRD